MGGEGLGNAVESTFAGGDSGGPSFLCDGGSGYECVGGRWVVTGINTFVTTPAGRRQSRYFRYFGRRDGGVRLRGLDRERAARGGRSQVSL